MLSILEKLLSVCPRLRNLTLSGVFATKEEKKTKLIIEHKYIENFRLSNNNTLDKIGEVCLSNCKRLHELSLDGFNWLTTVSVKNKNSLKNLFLRNLPTCFSTLKIEDCRSLKYLEIFLNSDMSCNALMNGDEDPYEFVFGDRGSNPPLKYFKFMVKFGLGMPR